MDRKIVETLVILRREPRLAFEGPRKGFGIVIANLIGNVVYFFVIHKQHDGLRYTRFHHIFLRRDTVKPGEFLYEMCARLLCDPGNRTVRKVAASVVVDVCKDGLEWIHLFLAANGIEVQISDKG